jgi:hypothetical protein
VRYDGVSYGVRVVELRPEPQVLLIDTDVEVEMMMSEAAEIAQAHTHSTYMQTFRIVAHRDRHSCI